MNLLIVVDMQNDFITGSLGSQQATDIVPRVIDKIKSFQGKVLYTRDTHSQDYLNTQEGKFLPIVHCVKDTFGWKIHDDIDALRQEAAFYKPTFGGVDLANAL